ncbi:ABC transporter permease [Alkalihalobacillus pseudalcaliphilus]|uniref:ABC transporter permease n=1 Tax=Alkalihalobacillus pseudalcaliphilus TaxID=79884 RepID=UPI00064D736E|nr:ABC transporter permease [Alkalihalobacillus pseudalcaliphilus]KMK78059.1 ABC transporter [Alkalihalobacillus pseudalcaliphilus]
MISLKRIQTVLIKDYKDLMKNAYILSTVVLPILFAYMFGRGEEVPLAMTVIPIILAMVVVGSFVQAGMIAEEKEKNTLRGLLLSPLNTFEIFIGKSLLSFLLTVLMIVIVTLISQFEVPANVLLFSLAVLVSTIFFIALGTILGLISRTVIETSVVGLPIMLIFGMGSLFRELFSSEVILTILNYLPDGQFLSLVVSLDNGGPVLEHFLVLGIWAFVAIIVCVIIFKRRRFD